MKYSKHKTKFWQMYTGQKLSENDLFEINNNLQEFAKVLLEIKNTLRKGKNNEQTSSNNGTF